jgi:hypothetical protein
MGVHQQASAIEGRVLELTRHPLHVCRHTSSGGWSIVERQLRICPNDDAIARSRVEPFDSLFLINKHSNDDALVAPAPEAPNSCLPHPRIQSLTVTVAVAAQRERNHSDPLAPVDNASAAS